MDEPFRVRPDSLGVVGDDADDVFKRDGWWTDSSSVVIVVEMDAPFASPPRTSLLVIVDADNPLRSHLPLIGLVLWIIVPTNPTMTFIPTRGRPVLVHHDRAWHGDAGTFGVAAVALHLCAATATGRDLDLGLDVVVVV